MIITIKNKYNQYHIISQTTQQSVELKEIFSTNHSRDDQNVSSHKCLFKEFFFTILENKITLINIKTHETKSSQFLLPKQDLPGGGIVVNSEYIFVILSNGTIFQFNWELKLIYQYCYRHIILSKPIMVNNKLYFIDYNNSLVEIDPITKRERICTTQLVSNNCILPIAAPVEIGTYIIFITSYGHVIFVNKEKFSVSSIGIDYKTSINIQFPILIYKNNIILTSPRETICIEILDDQKARVKWSIDIGSHGKPSLVGNKLMICDKSRLEIIDLDLEQRTMKITYMKNIKYTYMINNIIIVLTEEEEIFCTDLKTASYTKEKSNAFKYASTIDFLQCNNINYLCVSKDNSTTLYIIDILEN